MGRCIEQRKDHFFKVLQLSEAGIGYDKISNITGVPRTTIRGWLGRKEKIQKELYCYAMTEDHDHQESYGPQYPDFVNLYNKGHEAKEISELLDLPYGVICEWIATFASSTKSMNRMSVGTSKSSVAKEIKEAQAKSTGPKDAGDKSPASAITSDQSKEDLLKRIAELEKQLARETMRADVNAKIIDLAEKKFNIPIRKK